MFSSRVDLPRTVIIVIIMCLVVSVVGEQGEQW